MENKDKIIIVGDPSDERIQKLVSKLHNVEIMSASEFDKFTPPKRIDVPIAPPLFFEDPFRPPLTRAERRKLARKK